MLRLAGGRAAAFHEGTIALAMATPVENPARTTHERFGLVSGAIARGLRSLGIDARVGEVPGEYCPGAWSVNARGAVKLVGIGQRLVSGAAHVGAVIVVSDDERLRDLLVPVYAALGLDWDPATVGSVAGEAGPVGMQAVEEAVLRELAAAHTLVPTTLDQSVLDRASELESGRMAA